MDSANFEGKCFMEGELLALAFVEEIKRSRKCIHRNLIKVFRSACEKEIMFC